MTYEPSHNNYDRRDQRMLGIEDPGDIDYNKLSREMGSDTKIASTDYSGFKSTSADGNYGLDEADYGSGGVIPSSGSTGDKFGGVRLTSGASTVATDAFTSDIQGELNSMNKAGTYGGANDSPEVQDTNTKKSQAGFVGEKERGEGRRNK